MSHKKKAVVVDDVLPERPKDKTLEAFKEWIGQIAFKFGIGGGDKLNEEQWAAKHKEYWDGRE